MVKPGYKQTEVDLIPEDWSVTTIGLIADVKTGPFGSALHADDYVEDGTPIITVEHLGETGLTRQNLPMVSDQDKRRLSSYTMREGDIVFSRVGSVDRNAYVTAEEDGWLFSGRILRLRAKHESVSTKYLGYYFKAESAKERIRSVAVGQTMASLNTKIMDAFKVVLPPIQEQESIAKVLWDMDEIISALEAQLIKKKAIKQGAMQELLTGKKRLPGFSGKWDKFTLGKHGTLLRSSVNPQLTPNKLFFEYSMPAFDESKMPVRAYGSAMHSNRILIEGKVLLFNKLNVRQKRIWLVENCAENAVCSSEFLPYTSETINLELLLHVLNSDRVTNEFIGMSTGTSNSQKRIPPSAFMEYTVCLPVDMKEQSAIAQVFSEIDSEIEALQQKLEKYRQLKQGMMQQLLTGKIRLV